jgi:hypothetical protein
MGPLQCGRLKKSERLGVPMRKVKKATMEVYPVHLSPGTGQAHIMSLELVGKQGTRMVASFCVAIFRVNEGMVRFYSLHIQRCR